MLPQYHFLYPLLVGLGIIVSILIVLLYFKKHRVPHGAYLDFFICILFAFVLGFAFSVLFQNLYNFLFYGNDYYWKWDFTFFGGLFGGVIGFLLAYRFFLSKKKFLDLNDMWKIGPGALCIGHGIGRIGCFCAGCCYGVASDMGIFFPSLGYKAIPTQLLEAILLFMLGAILLILAFGLDFKYSAVLYCIVYAVGRYVLEIYRGDFRGAHLGPFSPSQIWCIALLAVSIPLFIYLKDNKVYEKEANI